MSKLTTIQFAERVKKTRVRVWQLISDGIIKAEKTGRDWLIDEDQILIVLNLPDNRGKYKRTKRKLKGEIAA